MQVIKAVKDSLSRDLPQDNYSCQSLNQSRAACFVCESYESYSHV